MISFAAYTAAERLLMLSNGPDHSKKLPLFVGDL